MNKINPINQPSAAELEIIYGRVFPPSTNLKRSNQNNLAFFGFIYKWVIMKRIIDLDNNISRSYN